MAARRSSWVVFLVAVIDWLQLRDPGVEVVALLDRAEREPSCAGAGTRLSLGAGKRTNLALARRPGARMLAAQRRLLAEADAASLLRLLEAQRVSPVESLDYEGLDDLAAQRARRPVGGRRLRVQATPGHTRAGPRRLHRRRRWTRFHRRSRAAHRCCCIAGSRDRGTLEP